MRTKTAIERLLKPPVQTALLFAWVKKEPVLLSLGPWPQCSKNQLQFKQKLLKSKCTIQLATFNVRTLNRIGQLPELTASAIYQNIDIICIQEHRYTHSKDIKYNDTGNGWTLATAPAWKNSVKAMIGGVDMLIGPRALKSLNSIEKKPRMMITTFNGNPSSTIISCYNRTKMSKEIVIIAF